MLALRSLWQFLLENNLVYYDTETFLSTILFDIYLSYQVSVSKFDVFLFNKLKIDACAVIHAT
jgi:hypothetical protein